MNARNLLLSLIVIASALGRAEASPIQKAIYTVPASTAGPAVTLPVLNISLTQTQGAAPGAQTLLFSLPEDLVGPGIAPILLYENAPGSPQYTGAGIQGDCEPSQTTAGETDCKLAYSPFYLQVDPAKVQAYLKLKYAATPEVADEKINESHNFLSDPEGVLSFTH
jgi:hypothetical protein